MKHTKLELKLHHSHKPLISISFKYIQLCFSFSNIHEELLKSNWLRTNKELLRNFTHDQRYFITIIKYSLPKTNGWRIPKMIGLGKGNGTLKSMGNFWVSMIVRFLGCIQKRTYLPPLALFLSASLGVFH